jgi:hypothetical protein
MTDAIRSGTPHLTLYTRPTVAPATAPAVPSAPPAQAPATPRPTLHRTEQGDRYTPSAAASEPALSARLQALSVNRGALTTLGAVDSMLAEHYGTAAEG